MLQTGFLEDCYSPKNPQEYEEMLSNEYQYWLPVIAGIATREEVELMTMDQLGVACAAAKMKIKLFGQGGVQDG